jgi:hypothetical protein
VATTLDKDPLSASLVLFLPCKNSYRTISRDSHFKAIVSHSLCAVCGSNTSVATTMDKDPLSGSLVLCLPCINSYSTISRDSPFKAIVLKHFSYRSMRRQHHCGDHPGQGSVELSAGQPADRQLRCVRKRVHCRTLHLLGRRHRHCGSYRHPHPPLHRHH